MKYEKFEATNTGDMIGGSPQQRRTVGLPSRTNENVQCRMGFLRELVETGNSIIVSSLIARAANEVNLGTLPFWMDVQPESACKESTVCNIDWSLPPSLLRFQCCGHAMAGSTSFIRPAQRFTGREIYFRSTKRGCRSRPTGLNAIRTVRGAETYCFCRVKSSNQHRCRLNYPRPMRQTHHPFTPDVLNDYNATFALG
jgi:hypothetical protein